MENNIQTFTIEESKEISNKLIPLWNELFIFTSKGDPTFKKMTNKHKRQLCKIEKDMWNIYKEYAYHGLEIKDTL